MAKDWMFLAHLTQRVRWAIVTTGRLSSVRPLTFHILINSSEATRPIWTKLWWNGPWMAPFQNCVQWSRLPTKMAAKLKIEKSGDEIKKKNSLLKLLSQSQPNFAEMIIGWFPSKMVSGISDTSDQDGRHRRT